MEGTRFEVWVDTRNTRGDVVQYIDKVYLSRSRAEARRALINIREDAFPNMVAWIEEDFSEEDSQHSRSKLTKNDVREIRMLLDQKVPVPDIAEMFGVSVSAIYDIRKGRSWSHLKAATID